MTHVKFLNINFQWLKHCRHSESMHAFTNWEQESVYSLSTLFVGQANYPDRGNKATFVPISKIGTWSHGQFDPLGNLITVKKITRFGCFMFHFEMERRIIQTILILFMLLTHSTSGIPLYFVCILVETHRISIKKYRLF